MAYVDRAQLNGLAIAVFRPNEDEPLTNPDLAALKIKTKTGDLTADKIDDTTGIFERFRATENIGIPKRYRDTETVVSMGVKALRRALDGRTDIDVIIVSSSIPGKVNLPEQMARELGLNPSIHREIGAACSGVPRGLYYLWENRKQLEGATVAFVASELYSPFLKPIDHTLFSDGAAAAVFQMGKDLKILHAQNDTLDAKEYENVIKMPVDRDLVAGRTDYIEEPVVPSDDGLFDQDGARVVGALRRHIAPKIREGTEKAGLVAREVGLVVPHQPSKIGLDVLSRSAPEFDFLKDNEQGNWSSGSVWKAFMMGIHKGEARSRMNIVLSGFGAGKWIFTSTTVVQLG